MSAIRSASRTLSIIGVLALAGATVMAGPGGSGLTTIDNPGGGEVVYGPISDATTMNKGMAVMLRSVHGHFGERPQIGKFFQTRGSNSIATFFTVTAKNQDGKQMAGLVIVSMPSGSLPTGALLFDQADRFAKTQPVLMKKLTEAWQKQAPAAAGPSQSAAAGRPQPVQPLHGAATPDGSATIGLPPGWKITGGGGGTLHAEGPKGESTHLGVIYQNIYDPRTQAGQGAIQYMSRGNTPYYVCPYGDDPVNSFLCVIKQARARDHKSVPTLNVLKRTNLAATQFEVKVVQIIAEMDYQDGKGPLKTPMRIGVSQMMAGGAWHLDVDATMIPVSLYEEEWPTVQAMISSYRQNGRVIANETQAVIANINARAAANRQLADARSAANDAHNASVEAQWDEQSRQSKVFENYILDRSVIQDNEQNARGTFSYGTADSLVRGNPNRFEYVPNQDLLKGVDY